jgi:uncharacterized phiE125 gp8 family phage protein
MLIRTSAAATAPVLLADVRKQCRAASNGDDDEELTTALNAAIGYAERFTGLALAEATYEARLSCWPCCGRWINIDIGPVRNVLAVTYVDENDATQTIAGADYDWQRTTLGARILFNSDYSFPTLTIEQDYPVVVSFEAGFDAPEAIASEGDDDSLKFPDGLTNALLLLAEFFYDRAAMPALKQTAEAMLSQVKVYR